VAQYTTEKLIELGGKVLTLSDSSGFVYDAGGIDKEKLAYVMELKNGRRGRIVEFATEFGLEFHAGKRPWGMKADLAFPSATQNEIHVEDAKTMLDNGIYLVSEGANMPTAYEATQLFEAARILFGPAKAANAGGVAISGLEMTQNAMRLQWTRAEVDAKLQDIMQSIHRQCVEYGRKDDDYVDYAQGANIAGFVKVANAMLAFGAV